MNKDNYHEQRNIIIILLLLPLGHISYSRTGGMLKFILVLLVHVEMLCSAIDLTLVISNYTPVACMLLEDAHKSGWER